MNRQMKVGIFVLFGLALCGVAVFLIGDSRRLWEPKVTFRAAFRDVAGLKPGAPVRTGGLDVGSVTAVGHADNAGDTRIYVTLQITKAEAARVREDTTARVANKGLLGDKMIELTVSDGRAPQQDPSKLLRTEEPTDMFAAANDLAQRVQRVVERIEPLAQSLGDPKFADDIKGSTQDLHMIMDAIAKNDSVAHRLLFDAEEGRKFSQLMTNLNHVTYNLDGVLADTRDVTSHVKNGPGIAHALVYDGEMSRNASGVMAEFHQDMKAIREGNGLAHSLLYGDDKSQHMMTNLNAITDDMRVIVSGVRQGKGTIGALLVDPSVYEDLKSAIGNVERNQVLRALVRYSIKADEQRPQVHTPNPATPAPAASK
jgi:phospholipid/cholesterol/gamma-HCH transport system substrate-binding protein